MVIPRPGARIRSTLAATFVVAVALAIGAIGVVWILRASLTQTVRASAEQRATDVATTVAAEGSARDAIVVGNPGERSVVQVLDSHGAVLVSSPEIDGEPALTSARPQAGSVQVTTQSVPVSDQEPFVVVSRGVHSPTGDAIVVVAQSLATVTTSVNTVARLLAFGFPVVLLVVAWSVYYVVGKTLRPVEEIRRRVASIGATDLDMRVPVPAADDEVGRLALTMNSMLDRLQDSQATQRRFVADASHELRSPLAAIRATVEVGLEHPGSQPWNDAAPAVLAETDRLSTLVDDLLLLARSDEIESPQDHHDVDLDDIMMIEADRLGRLGHLDVSVDVAPARVAGDRHQLERLVRNLCDNAARYATSSVALSVGITGTWAVLVVQDDGPGVPVADRDRIFDRFVRLDPARDRLSGGAGLGLAIVLEVARAHGGTAAVEDSASGARFVVRIRAKGA